MPKQEEQQNNLLDAYLFGVGYTSLITLVGHPVERCKVAFQTNLTETPYSVLKQFSGPGFRRIADGFAPCFLRQQSKTLYRPLLITYMPHEVDSLQLCMPLASFTKAALASGFDTVIGTPIENVKTTQMKPRANQGRPLGVGQAIKTIYQAKGVSGFFAGSTITMAKSLPTWTYLFMTYHAIKEKRDKENFLSTVLWATVASAPVAIVTTPLDVIKSQQQCQATTSVKAPSIRELCTQLYKEHGLGAFFRGFNCRLLNKSLSATGTYILLDMAQKGMK